MAPHSDSADEEIRELEMCAKRAREVAENLAASLERIRAAKREKFEVIGAVPMHNDQSCLEVSGKGVQESQSYPAKPPFNRAQPHAQIGTQTTSGYATRNDTDEDTVLKCQDPEQEVEDADALIDTPHTSPISTLVEARSSTDCVYSHDDGYTHPYKCDQAFAAKNPVVQSLENIRQEGERITPGSTDKTTEEEVPRYVLSQVGAQARASNTKEGVTWQAILSGSAFLTMSDIGVAPDAVVLSMAQFQICRLEKEDQIGRHNQLCCKFCFGQPGYGRHFPTTSASFVSSFPQTVVKHIAEDCLGSPAWIKELVSITHDSGQKSVPLHARHFGSKGLMERILKVLRSPCTDGDEDKTMESRVLSIPVNRANDFSMAWGDILVEGSVKLGTVADQYIDPVGTTCTRAPNDNIVGKQTSVYGYRYLPEANSKKSEMVHGSHSPTGTIERISTSLQGHTTRHGANETATTKKGNPTVPVTQADDMSVDWGSVLGCGGEQLVSSADLAFVPASLVVALAQFERCNANDFESQRISQIRVGICCKFCKGGSPPILPGARISKVDESAKLQVHVENNMCGKIPNDVLRVIKQLREREEKETRRYGSRKFFFHKVWARLHGQEIGESTSDAVVADTDESDRPLAAELSELVEDSELVVVDSDRGLVSDCHLVAFAQLQPCTLTKQDHRPLAKDVRATDRSSVANTQGPSNDSLPGSAATEQDSFHESLFNSMLDFDDYSTSIPLQFVEDEDESHRRLGVSRAFCLSPNGEPRIRSRQSPWVVLTTRLGLDHQLEVMNTVSAVGRLFRAAQSCEGTTKSRMLRIIAKAIALLVWRKERSPRLLTMLAAKVPAEHFSDCMRVLKIERHTFVVFQSLLRSWIKPFLQLLDDVERADSRLASGFTRTLPHILVQRGSPLAHIASFLDIETKFVAAANIDIHPKLIIETAAEAEDPSRFGRRTTQPTTPIDSRPGSPGIGEIDLTSILVDIASNVGMDILDEDLDTLLDSFYSDAP